MKWKKNMMNIKMKKVKNKYTFLESFIFIIDKK